MRISLFLNNDLESNIALNCLLPTLSNHQFNVFLSEKVGNESSIVSLQQLAFLEREFPTQHLFPKLNLIPNDALLSFDQISNKYKVPVHLITSLEASLETISAFSPDLYISIRFGKIFKGKALTIPPLGIINLHSAILPNYKGVLGTFRAILNGDKKIGTTIHYIDDSNIDTGKIIHINERIVSPDKSILWHIVNLYPQACHKLCELIDLLSSNKKIQSFSQKGTGNYYTFPSQEEFDKLKAAKIELFNLNEYIDIITTHYAVDRKWVAAVIQDSKGLQP